MGGILPPLSLTHLILSPRTPFVNPTQKAVIAIGRTDVSDIRTGNASKVCTEFHGKVTCEGSYTYSQERLGMSISFGINNVNGAQADGGGSGRQSYRVNSFVLGCLTKKHDIPKDNPFTLWIHNTTF